jgi:solute:Na+ symporter, SSS family
VPVHAIFGSNLAVYNGVTAILANILVATLLSALLPNRARDETREDYADIPAGQVAA